jgi:Fur family ferric uptake transcriptional regulator
MTDSQTILKNNGLSITSGRKHILDLFLDADTALAESDIENSTPFSFDRATVHRTLQTFCESGIIHQLPASDKNVLYELSKENISGEENQEDRVLFICVDCEKNIIMDDVMVPEVRMPKGFSQISSEMVVRGICDDCRR